MKLKLFTLWIGCLTLILPVMAQNHTQTVTAYQYYFDTDPSVGVTGNGAIVAISPTAAFNQTVTINTPTLGQGLHTVYVRVKDEFGKWGLTEHNTFYVQPITPTQNVTAYQYYFDTDPGVGVTGNGNVVSVSPTSVFNQTVSFSIPTLSAGLHTLYLRTKDENGKWGLNEHTVFYVQPATSTQTVTALEYYYDTDPGVGNGTSIPVTTGATVNGIFPIGAACLSAGVHSLYVRAKDEYGRWGLIEQGNLTITTGIAQSVIAASGPTTVCTGNTVTLAPTVTGPGLTYQWLLSGNPISGATNSTYTASASGSHSLKVTCNASFSISNTIVINVNAPVTYYADGDGDGYGNSTVTQSSCTGAPAGYVANSTDCNDANGSIHPGVTDVCGDGIDNDCTGGDLACPINTWKGGSTVWTDPANWTVAVPTATTHGLIPTTPVNGNNFPIIITGAPIANLTVETGASVTVNTPGVLTLNGTLANAGDVTIKSGGSFMQGPVSSYTGAGTFKVERIVTNTANGYRDICSPVATTVADLADDFSVSGQDGVQCWYSYSPYPNVQVYDEALSIVNGDFFEGWLSRTNPGNTLVPMQGIAVRTYQGASYTLDFTGTPNNGAQSISVSKTTSTGSPLQNDGWNFVGNPYPSAIDWTAVYALNPGISGSYYVYNTGGEYTGNFGTCNGAGVCTGLNGITQYIGVGQGFFVRKTTTGTGSFIMNNSVRTANAANFYKTEALDNEIRLTLSNGVNSDEILAYTNANATPGYDEGLDAEKIAAGSTAYMGFVMPDFDYAINALNEITEQTVLPLIIWVTDSGTYTITGNALNLTDLTAYLKDAQADTLYDLSVTTPTFAFAGGQSYTGRFSVVFKAALTSGVSGPGAPVTKIYSHGAGVFVERNSTTPAIISISNVLGQRIADLNTQQAKTEIPIATTGLAYVFVKVTEGSKVSTAKVLISNK